MQKTVRLIIASLLAIGLFVGCSGDAGSSDPVVTTTGSKTMASDSFDASTGAVTKETPIKVGDTGTAMNIPVGTVLQDEQGNPVTKAPEVKAKVEKSKKEAKTTIDFTVDGKKVIPTESVVMSVPAPAGAKAGETVQIEVPDGITSKLIFVVVNANGTVNIRIFPKAFRKAIVIIVKIKDNSTN